MRCFLTLRPGNRLVAAEPLLLVHIGLDQARINRERFATNKPSRDACRLTEVEWRILQVLSRLNGNLESEAAGARRRTIATSSTASYGGFAPARRGAMCRKSTGNGTQFTGASGAGAPAGWGRVWPSRSPRPSTALRFAPMSRQRAERGDSSSKRWCDRWLWHQDALQDGGSGGFTQAHVTPA